MTFSVRSLRRSASSRSRTGLSVEGGEICEKETFAFAVHSSDIVRYEQHGSGRFR